MQFKQVVKTEDLQRHHPYDQRSSEWNEEQEEFPRHKAYKLYEELFKIKGHYSDVHKTNWLKSLRPYKCKEYHDRLGDTFQRKVVHCRQWCFVPYDGITFFEQKEKKSIRQSSKSMMFRHGSKGLHQGTWRFSLGTFGGRFTVSAIVRKAMQ